MRLIRGTVNALLMVTLMKPVARLTVARWRKQVKESPAGAMGLPVQELLETALLEELGATAADVEAEALSPEPLDLQSGRSTIRTLLIVGALVVVTAGAAVAIMRLVRSWRAAQAAKERELVPVPVETSDESIEDAVQESLIG